MCGEERRIDGRPRYRQNSVGCISALYREFRSLLSCWRRKSELNDLPDEILLKIFSHIGPEDLIVIIAKVCERWNVLAKDMVLWKTLSYSCDYDSDISCIAKVLTNAPALHSLIISFRLDVADILEFLNHKQLDLRKLILKNSRLGKDGNGLLTNIEALYPDLEGLSLERFSPLTTADYHLIPHLKKLSELKLSDCEGLSRKTVRLIVDSCQHLQRLTLRGVEQFLDDDVIHVIKKLGKQLTALTLDGQDLTDVAYLYLSNCSRLQELALFDCRGMTDRGLLEGIGSLHGLTSLHLNMGRELTAQALSIFLHRPSMTSIVVLKLVCCDNLDDEGVKGIAERCTHLKELIIYDCYDVTDAGIRMVIIHCNQLRELYLEGILNIVGGGYPAFVVSHLPHLRFMRLVERDSLPRLKWSRDPYFDVPKPDVF